MKKLVLIPGSFKPPHKGHYEMIKFYSEMVGDDGEVKVFVSDPKTKKHLRLDCFGREIPAIKSISILKTFCKTLKNVEVIMSQMSPVTDCYEAAKAAGEREIIVGVSCKGNDIKRWDRLPEWLKKNNPLATVKIIAANIKHNVSASELRAEINKKEKVMSSLPDHLSQIEKNKIFSYLNQE